MRVQKQPEPITLFDRLALIIGGIAIGSGTLFGYSIAAAFVSPKAGFAFAILFLSPLGLAFVAACGIAGAIFGPAKLADFFGMLWGTHSFWTTYWGRWVAIAVAVALFTALVLLREGILLAP